MSKIRKAKKSTKSVSERKNHDEGDDWSIKGNNGSLKRRSRKSSNRASRSFDSDDHEDEDSQDSLPSKDNRRRSKRLARKPRVDYREQIRVCMFFRIVYSVQCLTCVQNQPIYSKEYMPNLNRVNLIDVRFNIMKNPQHCKRVERNCFFKFTQSEFQRNYMCLRKTWAFCKYCMGGNPMSLNRETTPLGTRRGILTLMSLFIWLSLGYGICPRPWQQSQEKVVLRI